MREEEEIYSLLQYHVYILTRVLRDGQTAILKIRGSYSHRTSEYLFLLKLVFSDRLLMHKNIASNPFSSHKYFICEKYNRENGLIVHEYLRQNYGLLTEQRQLLLNREAMFGQDFQFNIMKFNNSNPLFTCFK